MVGFRNDVKNNFTFHESIDLKMTMSDILGGQCNKKIGYTLRVGGRGSKIKDNNIIELVEDKIFKSPSLAFGYVVNNSSNGLIDWKDKDGKTSDTYIKKK